MPKTGLSRTLFAGMCILITLAVAVILATNTAPPASGDNTGTLTGNVTIGPLCPVEPCTVAPDRIAAAYAARPIRISTPGGIMVASVIADPAAGYAIALKPGTYVVDVEQQGSGRNPDLPGTVTIRSGGTVWLNISLDTGIR